MSYSQKNYIEANEELYRIIGRRIPISDLEWDQIVAHFSTAAVTPEQAASWRSEFNEKLVAVPRDTIYMENCKYINFILSKGHQIAAAPEDGMKNRIYELEDAVRWALGEIGDFSARGPAQGAYWWRSELRRRARLIKPKTPEERVIVTPQGNFFAVKIDGVLNYTMASERSANIYRLGLIETLKKESTK